MTDDDYIAKLKAIRDRLLRDHRDSVLFGQPGNPSARSEMLQTFEELQAFERILAAEEAKLQLDATDPGTLKTLKPLAEGPNLEDI